MRLGAQSHELTRINFKNYKTADIISKVTELF